MQHSSTSKLVCRIADYKSKPFPSTLDRPFRAKIPSRPDYFICNIHTAICDYGVKRIVIALRVSDRHQKDNLYAQKQEVLRYLKQFKIRIVKIVTTIGTGRVFGQDRKPVRRYDLEELAYYARKYDAAIFAEDITRFIRPSKYTKENQWIQLEERELQRLEEITRSAILVTKADPLTPFKDLRKSQITKSMSAANKLKPKKYKIKLKDKLISKVLILHSKDISNRQISKELGIHRNTINKWIKEIEMAKI
jgi:hypothetical protein